MKSDISPSRSPHKRASEDFFGVSLIISVALHAALLVIVIFGLPGIKRKLPEIEITAVEMLPITDKNNVPTQKVQREKAVEAETSKKVQAQQKKEKEAEAEKPKTEEKPTEEQEPKKDDYIIKKKEEPKKETKPKEQKLEPKSKPKDKPKKNKK